MCVWGGGLVGCGYVCVCMCICVYSNVNSSFFMMKSFYISYKIFSV